MDGLIPAGSVEVEGDREVALEIVTGTVAGRVLDEAGSPLAGATVSLRASGSSFNALSYHHAATTDEHGEFELRVPPGTYEATLQEDGRPTKGPVTVQVTPGGTVQTVIVLKELPGS